MFSRLLVAGATLAAGAVFAPPAAASVTYDPAAKTGFVDATDVRKALGWSGAALAARAAALVFDHEFWADDTYAVTCGKRTFPVVHHRDFGRFELSDTVSRDVRRGSSAGYRGRVRGFRLTGPHLGISGTSVPPAPGQPCPGRPGSSIDRAELSGSATGWALTVRYGDVRRRLLARQQNRGR
jgi:hypothetical protein